MLKRTLLGMFVTTALCSCGTVGAQERPLERSLPVSAQDMDEAYEEAQALVEQMTAEEKTRLTYTMMPVPGLDLPEDALSGAGYAQGVPRLNIPSLNEADGPSGLRAAGIEATAMPSGIALGATFDRELAYDHGVAIGAEARANGFNVLLAGGANLARDPRNGRTFEYIAEDPLLTGEIIGWNIAGIQSNEIVSTIKHFALNGQETARRQVDVVVGDAAARESDLLAFQIGMEIGQPGSVMCAYNRVNGEKACASEYLLETVLRDDWDYKGWVMSDWGAVPGLFSAWNGLDQQSGAQLDEDVWFDETLMEAAEGDPERLAQIDTMNARVIAPLIATGLMDNPVAPGGEIDWDAHAAIADRAAEQGIVLLKNNGVLPLAGEAETILVVGGYAESGVLSGGGSSQVTVRGGNPITRILMNKGAYTGFTTEQYHGPAPLDSIIARAPDATVRFRPGRYVSDAAGIAGLSDLVIVFATQWMAEGIDQPDLSLSDGQDALIAAIAAENPNTIVVLETGGPVAMPWLDDVAAVVEAWYPGQGGAEAIARVLFGEANPSGRLPITFPRTTEDLPRTEIAGILEYDPNNTGGVTPGPNDRLETDYDIEGSDLGYRWNAREGHEALFPFGFGLSYTSFAGSDFATDGATASFTITNTGERAGAAVGQVYLVTRNGEPLQRLVGFERLELEPGEAKAASVTIDPRLLADWNGTGWTIPAGTYGFAYGDNAEALGDVVEVTLQERNWED